MCFACKLIPRANSETIITPINAIAHSSAKVMGDRAFVFDGQIRNTASRIELVRSGKRVGRANVEAILARAAMIALLFIGSEA